MRHFSYEIRTNFVRISYQFRTICMNLYHFSPEQTHSAHSTQHSNTTNNTEEQHIQPIAHSTATQQQHRRTTHSAHSTQHSNTTTTQKNNTVRSSATVTNEEQQTHKAQQAASKTTIPTQPKSRHYTHIMTISSNKHKRQTVTNYKQHKSIVPHDSTTGSHPSNHPHPPIAHSTATQQQHRRTTQSGHQQQSPVRSSRHTKHNKQQAKQRYQHSRKAGITHTS